MLWCTRIYPSVGCNVLPIQAVPTTLIQPNSHSRVVRHSKRGAITASADALQHHYSFTLSINTLRPRQKSRHFTDDISKHIFFNENVWISLTITLNFFLKRPINNIPAFVQIMAWRRPGDKPLFEPMLLRLSTYMCVTRSQWVKMSWVIFRKCIQILYLTTGSSPFMVSLIATSCLHDRLHLYFKHTFPLNNNMAAWHFPKT